MGVGVQCVDSQTQCSVLEDGDRDGREGKGTIDRRTEVGGARQRCRCMQWSWSSLSLSADQASQLVLVPVPWGRDGCGGVSGVNVERVMHRARLPCVVGSSETRKRRTKKPEKPEKPGYRVGLLRYCDTEGMPKHNMHFSNPIVRCHYLVGGAACSSTSSQPQGTKGTIRPAMHIDPYTRVRVA